MNTVTIRAARLDELPIVSGLWDEAAAWLATRGIDQWQYPARRAAIAHNIACGECWLVEQDGATIATITLDHQADPEFWRPEDDPGSALYAHRMAVHRDAAGNELGSALLDWASRRAASEGKRWLRLDAWKSNPGLQQYYEDRGFQIVRCVELPHRRSGALYQRPAGQERSVGPSVREGT